MVSGPGAIRTHDLCGSPLQLRRIGEALCRAVRTSLGDDLRYGPDMPAWVSEFNRSTDGQDSFRRKSMHKRVSNRRRPCAAPGTHSRTEKNQDAICSQSTRLNSISSSFFAFLNLTFPSLIFPICNVFSTCLSLQQLMFQSGILTIRSLVTPEATGNKS